VAWNANPSRSAIRVLNYEIRMVADRRMLLRDFYHALLEFP
jgi:hypothetical protein